MRDQFVDPERQPSRVAVSVELPSGLADVPVDVLGTIVKPNVMDWDRNHPVMRNVEFSKVAITNALRMRPLASLAQDSATSSVTRGGFGSSASASAGE